MSNSPTRTMRTLVGAGALALLSGCAYNGALVAQGFAAPAQDRTRIDVNAVHAPGHEGLGTVKQQPMDLTNSGAQTAQPLAPAPKPASAPANTL